MDEPTEQRTSNDEPGFVGRVRDRAGEQVTTQKNRATDSMKTIAQAVRRSAQELREGQQPGLAEYIERGSDQLERLSERLKNKDLGEMLRDAQTFARQRPAVFIGSAFAAGLLAARFLKSSSPTAGSNRSWIQPGQAGVLRRTSPAIPAPSTRTGTRRAPGSI
jgi:hypothetical protein